MQFAKDMGKENEAIDNMEEFVKSADVKDILHYVEHTDLLVNTMETVFSPVIESMNIIFFDFAKKMN